MTNLTAIQTITESQRLELIGLVSLAAKVNQERERIEEAMASITGEPSDGIGGQYFGVTSDAASEAGYGTDAVSIVGGLLRKLDIEVDG